MWNMGGELFCYLITGGKYEKNKKNDKNNKYNYCSIHFISRNYMWLRFFENTTG